MNLHQELHGRMSHFISAQVPFTGWIFVVFYGRLFDAD
jgi:hypothetical protein